MRHGRRSPTRWWVWVGLWMVVGLGIRLASVYVDPGKVAGGDAYFYFNGAKLLLQGHGFINPYYYVPPKMHHQVVPSADFPPLFILLQTIPQIVGLKTFLAARVWDCILGTGAIAVCAYTGREIAGRRAGLITAFLIAVYPNIWLSDQLALSESIAPLLVAALLLCAYRFWKEPSLKRGVWLGVAMGLTMLGRDELSLLAVFLIIPLVLLARTLSWKRRFSLLAIVGLTTALVIAPWVGYNLSRFQKPVFISAGLGVTMASADCATTWSGSNEGYWSMPCALAYSDNPWFTQHPKADDSALGSEFEHLALEYVRHHENRLVPVTLAKIGRTFAFFHPLEQIQIDSYVETRPYAWAAVGLVMYYALLPLAIAGTVILRRRRVPSFPLWAVALNVVCASALTFGQTRYRTTFEVSLVLLAAVALDALWSRLRRRELASPLPPSSVDPPLDEHERPDVPALTG
jgi:4-amino-4-deoxy-L-arabinose transferase-like glycosyltransferase